MRKLLFVFLLVPLFAFAQMSTYGPTAKTDQLWQVAIVARPNATVSIQQAMVAIFQANPEAFSDKNMNGLKPSMILQIPSLEKISAVPNALAASTVAAQDSAWTKMQEPKKHAAVQHTKKIITEAKRATRHEKHMQAVLTVVQTDQEKLQNLKKQYGDIGTLLISFDQQYQVRLGDLEKHNLDQQNQIDQLKQTLTQLQQQLTANQQQLVAVQEQDKPKGEFFTPYVTAMRNYLGDTGFKIIVGIIVIILLLLIWWAFPGRHFQKEKAKDDIKKGHDPDVEGEYDFLGSKEGIPAKLDLARAYIDMGDKEAAREMLKEILEKGNTEQKEEARVLLSKVIEIVEEE